MLERSFRTELSRSDVEERGGITVCIQSWISGSHGVNNRDLLEEVRLWGRAAVLPTVTTRGSSWPGAGPVVP